ncbi:hypothetical protein A9K55_009070 [Cordyceps militaris]|uniref:Uncharacterized protein n=1 Tax=Cordyceps militaris TaxID=73501 RepID=A0A2H4SG57_CORMI|nr:hypothetical protein A9K55_009070 [Cordyceps militaris]
MDPCSPDGSEKETLRLTKLATAPPATAPAPATAASATAAATKPSPPPPPPQQPVRMSTARFSGSRPDFETKRKQRSISVTRYVGAD